MKTPVFGVVGGDLRQQKLMISLQKRGFDAKCFGLGEKDVLLEEVMETCNPILLPLPVTADGTHLFAPFMEGEVPLATIFEKCREKRVFGGKVSPSVEALCKQKGVRIEDYFAREEMTVRNVVPTVEGALQLAMEQTDETLHGTNCVVIGYGRLGKVLSKSLHALGAQVTVSARKASDFAWCQVEGLRWTHHRDLQDVLCNAKLVFNTVPFMMMPEGLLSCLRKDCVIIDLASAPGGVDFAAAQNLSLTALHALSLPGKVAPQTAADIICDTVLGMWEEAGSNG